MSDFDKEAEREKLREKYGEESDERAATRQMSELLLKGATMTNKHCDTCGDPVFRYDGQEFCPTCQGVDGDGQAGEPEPEAATTESSADGGTESPTTGGERPVEVDTPDAARESQDATAGGERASADEGASDERRAAEPRQQREAGTTPTRERSSRGAQSETEERRLAPAPATGDPGEDLRAGRRSLERTLARFARAAEESDDPRAAREHLAAAREAAEALSALRR